MTPDELYEKGYNDAMASRSANAAYINLTEYKQGYEDGTGDKEYKKPIGEFYDELNKAPVGFEFIGEKRVAQPGEYYLTKNGNAKRQEGVRRNNQTRHILRRITYGGITLDFNN